MVGYVETIIYIRAFYQVSSGSGLVVTLLCGPTLPHQAGWDGCGKPS